MRVDFAFNAQDRVAQAVRTTIKQVEKGVRLMVYCPELQRAQAYDRLLWSMDDTAFIAHERLNSSAMGNLAVYLIDDENWPAAQTYLQSGYWLLNLHDQCPPLPNPGARVLEIVSHHDADKSMARERWRQYQQVGYSLHAHQLGSS